MSLDQERWRRWLEGGVAILILLAVGAVGCCPGLVRFPLAAPVWEDPDRNHVPGRPGEAYLGNTSDFADHSFIHQRPEVPPTSSMWLHFYDLGPRRGFRLVGRVRQPKPVTPETW